MKYTMTEKLVSVTLGTATGILVANAIGKDRKDVIKRLPIAFALGAVCGQWTKVASERAQKRAK